MDKSPTRSKSTSGTQPALTSRPVPPPNAASYSPRPLDTSKLKVPEDIQKLTELLAENAHDHWSKNRFEQGWKWGPVRNEDAKEHPCLIPYKDLPDSEKVLDRNTALETIKAVMSFGLARPNKESSHETTLTGLDPAERSKRIIAQLKKPRLTLAELRRLWQDRMPIVWLSHVDVYRRAVDASLKLGESFLAFDIAEEGLAAFKGDLRLVQLQALALARTGATGRANDILEHLRLSGHQDEETLGILARTHKDLWLLSTDAPEKERHLKLSFELYAEAYRRNRGYYSGINAAAMGLIYGEKEKAHQWAEEVSNMCLMCQSAISPDSDENYWIEATLAESELIRGRLESAEKHYSFAAQSGSQSWVDLNRTREQARRLLEHSGRQITLLDHCFRLPNIVVCAGHMFDRPNRKSPRFPYAMESRVRDEMKKKLADMKAQVGFASLACGSDMLFSELILERGGEINIVLPFNKEDFKSSSVDFIAGANFGVQFEKILENAASVTTLNEMGTANDPAAYEYANLALMGLSLLKGQFLGIDVMPLVVWNGQEGDGRGGTASFVQFWRDRGTHVEVIDIKKLANESIQLSSPAPVVEVVETLAQPQLIAPSPTEISAQEIKAMLFADIKGYTQLSELQIPIFVHHFLGKVATLMDAMKKPPIVRNTWGDAIHCVFDSVSDAGIFALNLRDLVGGTDWAAKGLRKDLNIRIALHAGPAYPCFDPVLRKITYMGSHVNRTARIEPIAEEGQIYASQAFAALGAADGVKEFVCDYVGQKQLAKNAGAIPVFLVRRKG